MKEIPLLHICIVLGLCMFVSLIIKIVAYKNIETVLPVNSPTDSTKYILPENMDSLLKATIAIDVFALLFFMYIAIVKLKDKLKSLIGTCTLLLILLTSSSIICIVLSLNPDYNNNMKDLLVFSDTVSFITLFFILWNARDIKQAQELKQEQ